MMKLAMRNYIRAFRWQNIKESYQNGTLFTLLYLGLILPLIQCLGELDVAAIHILTFLPIVFTMFTSVLYPMALPKLMYLCPMSKEMRKKYIVIACYIRAGVPILLTLLILAFLLFSGITDWICALGILLNNTMFSLCLGSGTNVKGFGDIDQRGYRSVPMNTAFSLCEGGIIIVSMLLGFGYTAWGGIDSPLWLKLSMLIITLLIPVPLTRYYLKYWPGSVENALLYENTMKQPTILKK